MSKYINVNPDHYKLAGRERPGDAVAGKRPKQKPRPDKDVLRREWERKQKEKEKGRR